MQSYKNELHLELDNLSKLFFAAKFEGSIEIWNMSSNAMFLCAFVVKVHNEFNSTESAGINGSSYPDGKFVP